VAMAVVACMGAAPAHAGGLDGQQARALKDVLQPLVSLLTVLYIVRIPMTWFPAIDFSKLPWAIIWAPTEPLLAVTRKTIPKVSGVDVSPIVVVGLLSFLSEILLGQQGLLSLWIAQNAVLP